MQKFKYLTMLLAADCFSKDSNDAFFAFMDSHVGGYSVKDTLLRTDMQIAMFLGQCSHESEGLSDTLEDVYTTPSVIKRVFHKYVESDEHAVELSKSPRKLFNLVYNGRMGNVAGTDDGFNYRGRGFLQTTGRNNYTSLEKETGISVVSNPHLVEKPAYAFISAAHYFKVTKDKNGDNLFEMSKSVKDIEAVTRKINGGYHGLKDRKRLICASYNAASGSFKGLGKVVHEDIDKSLAGIVQYIIADVSDPTIKVDCDWGKKTTLAVEKFREEQGITRELKMDDLYGALAYKYI